MKEMDVQELIRKAQKASREYAKLSLTQRRGIINHIKEKLLPFVPELARIEYQETEMGNIHDKIIKLALSIEKTPGVEDLTTEVMTGDDGMTLCEYSAYGLACALQPSTNPCATLINNSIGMLAAGNALINIPHPRCTKSASEAVMHIEDAISEVSGISNLITSVEVTTIDATREIINNPDISLVVATGSESKVRRALKCGKRVIAAGAANPVVIIDETADWDKASKDVVAGASFDHGVLCVSENNIVVIDSVAEAFINGLKRMGAYFIENVYDMMRLTQATVTEDLKANKLLEGKSAKTILNAAGIETDNEPKLIVVDTVKSHPFAQCEMRMPLIPMVRVNDFEKAVDTALFIEQGYKHSAYIHSQSIVRLNEAAKRMQTSLFVKNGSSLTGMGFFGDGNTSFTLANITGEGLVTAKNFARKRRCTLTSGFSIR